MKWGKKKLPTYLSLEVRDFSIQLIERYQIVDALAHLRVCKLRAVLGLIKLPEPFQIFFVIFSTT